MPKNIDPIKKAKVKQGLITGKSTAEAMKDAGYADATAMHNVSPDNPLLKTVRDEIAKDFRLTDVTVKQVVKELEQIRQLAIIKGDLGTAGRMAELKGRYLAIFTDKVKLDAILITSADQQIIDEYMPKPNAHNRLGNVVAN